MHIYIIISKNIRYLLWNRGAWRFFHDTYLTIEVQGIRCTNHLHDSCPFTDVNPHFTAPGCRYYLRDWSRSGGSYGNNTRVICCPAPGRPESAARGTSPPDNKSRGCCCRNSRPTVINPDYNMTKQRYITRIYDKKTFKITTKSSDVAYLPPLWRHASLLNDGSCSFTHPVAKGRSARGTSPGT